MAEPFYVGGVMSEPRVIKKYPNRRLYDPAGKRYVSLADIREMITAGLEVTVVDRLTSEDITRSVLLQVISAQERDGVCMLTREFLLQLIRGQNMGPRSQVANYLERCLELFKSNERRGR